MTPPDFTWVDDSRELERLVEHLAGQGEFALDTESDGFHHYFDKLCLIQISTASRHAVVDPLALDSLAPLAPVLEDPSICKILHAAEQDLMYLRRDHSIHLRGLYDTLLGGQFLGHSRLGLAALLEHYFEIKLSKSNQLDDWSQRPLTDRQLTYAISDTSHLIPLAGRIREELQPLNRSDWAQEEIEALETKELRETESQPDDLTRVKGWKELPPRGRAILRELLLVRDAEARRRDRPPFRIVSNAVLLGLAQVPPEDEKAIHKMKGFPRARAERLARQLLQAVRKGQDLPEAQFPADPARKNRGNGGARVPEFDARVDALKAWRKKKGTELGLEPGVITPQRDLDLMAVQGPSSLEQLQELPIRQWRQREFGEEWLRILAGCSGASTTR